MGKYLDRLNAVLSEKRLGEEPSKGSKAPFDTFEGDQHRHVSEITPPFDADGVPCGMCPTCHRGEFWRYPHFHPDHKPNGWTCWFCAPPPKGSGPCDFCGVPEPDPFKQVLTGKKTR